MKYKLILYNTYSSQSETDLAGNFTFYTFAAAHECAQAWAAISGNFEARLWDGTSWRFYS